MTVVQLRTKTREAEQTTLFCLRQAVLGSVRSGVSEKVVARIATILDRELQAQSGWQFVMVNAELNANVVRYLADHSRRPLKACQLWAALFTTLPPDSNEVQATRAELAAMIGVEPRTVSELVGELEAINAVYRRRSGRNVRYCVHPRLGTHLGGAARARAQDEAPALAIP